MEFHTFVAVFIKITAQIATTDGVCGSPSSPTTHVWDRSSVTDVENHRAHQSFSPVRWSPGEVSAVTARLVVRP